MIFGVLMLRKFDINSLDICHLTCIPLFLGRSKKVIFQQYYLCILQSIYVISKENEQLLPYAPPLKNVTALPCKMHNFSSFSFFHTYWVTIHDTDELQKYLVATWLNFSKAWWMMQLISGKKDWKHPCIRWSLWTFAVTLLVWHSNCRTSQPVLFRA